MAKGAGRATLASPGVPAGDAAGRGSRWLSLQAKLIGAPSAGQRHAGQEQVDLLLKSLSEHPGRFNKQVLRGRLVAVASDGAGTRGGEDSHHGSTAAAELFWSRIHPEADAKLNLPVGLDLFHRADLAVSKAVGDTPCALEMFDVGRALAALLATGVSTKGAAPAL